MVDMTFAETLEAKRSKKGISQRYLAELMDISPQYLNDLLRARRGPTPELASKAATIFRLSPLSKENRHMWHRLGAVQCGWELPHV